MVYILMIKHRMALANNQISIVFSLQSSKLSGRKHHEICWTYRYDIVSLHCIIISTETVGMNQTRNEWYCKRKPDYNY